MRRLLFALLYLPLFVSAQETSGPISVYPQGYFRNPLNIPILLAGNFGECRPNHFHSGIDIKTNGKENLPVLAAADGYISRIKMEKGGFGHALYLTHPNGFTTLYAHLNRFTDAVERYTSDLQYQKESWAVDISLRPEQFPVKKGQQIAWSGNTGASSAPHLHFEIRDTETEHPLNPMLFGFTIADKKSPIPTGLVLYNMSGSIYDQEPKVLSLKKKGAVFAPALDTLDVPELLGIGIDVNDFMNGSDNTLNFYTAEWYLDEVPQGSIRLDDIGYEETRYLHAYVDYQGRRRLGRWIQLLFRLPGNKLTHIYTSLNDNRGMLSLRDGQVHPVSIGLMDAAGNRSTIRFYVRAAATAAEEIKGDCADRFRAGNTNKFSHPNLKLSFEEPALYDDICFQMGTTADEQSLSDRFSVHTADVPVHRYFDLHLKPNKPVPFDLRDKIVLMYSDGRTRNGKAAAFENGWYKAAVRNFGNYWLASDTVAPVITTLQKEGAVLSKARQLRFRVTEGITSVKEFRAELDGRWISFEPRGDLYFYTFDGHCSKGSHKLVVTATDENNNRTTVVYNFTR